MILWQIETSTLLSHPIKILGMCLVETKISFNDNSKQRRGESTVKSKNKFYLLVMPLLKIWLCYLTGYSLIDALVDHCVGGQI